MTFENKYLVEPSDISVVHFECAKCGAAISVPIGRGVTEQAAKMAGASCQFCREPWGFQPGSSEYKTLCNFAEALETLASNLKGRNLRLRLEIKTEPSASHAFGAKD